MEKKYNLIHQFRLETSVMVEGERVFISFEGGSLYRIRRNGSYITRDPKVQAALESDAGYDSQWTLDPAYKNDVEELAEEVTAEPELVVEPVNTEETVVNPEPENGPVPEEVVEPVAESTEVTAEEVTAEPVDGTPAVDEKLLEVNNYTLAKNYIKELFPEVTRAEILSEEKLREYAKEKGITFPNW